MAFTIVQQMEQPGPDMFYEEDFRHLIEIHLPQLKTMYAVRKPLRPEQVYQYEGDFSGFLLDEGYGLEMCWVMTRVNGMTNPNQFGKTLRDPYSTGVPEFYIEPHPEAIAELQQYYITLKQG
jgi:hypothetical protein